MNLIAAMFAVFVACWPAAPARAAEKVSVQLNWKHQFEFAAFYAAEAQGFYRQAGLDVDIREGGPGVDTVKEVTSGRADFGIGAASLVVDRYRGAPVMVIATLMQHSPVGLLALRRHGVHSVLDLADRPVAVAPHNRDEIEAYLLAAGIPRTHIQLVNQVGWDLADLERGAVAAKVVYLSNEPWWTKGREHEYLLLTPVSAGIDLFGDMLFANTAIVASRPDAVRAFREATLKGLVYALDHPEELSDLIIARYDSQGKTRDHLLFEAAQMRNLTRHDIVEPGYMSPGRWQHVVTVFADRGQLPRDFDLSEFIYDATPHKAPPWLIRTLVALLAILVAAMLVALKLRSLNQRLRGEMAERAEAEAALAASEKNYRELVENANTIVLRMDADGKVTYFNEFAERFFGYRAEEIVGRPALGTPERETDSHRDLCDMMDALLAHPENSRQRPESPQVPRLKCARCPESTPSPTS
ncbi:MAG: ABC transporter substrate-binding protein [Ignavibacteria bacterium]